MSNILKATSKRQYDEIARRMLQLNVQLEKVFADVLQRVRPFVMHTKNKQCQQCLKKQYADGDG